MKNKNKFSQPKYRIPLYVLLGLSIVLIGVGFSIYSSNNANQAGIVLGIIGIVVFLITLGYAKIIIDGSRKYCDSCGESMSGCEYEYQEKKQKWVEGTGDNAGHYNVEVYIRAKCPHCGAIKEFTRTFKVGANSDDIQYQVDNFCRKSFGH